MAVQNDILSSTARARAKQAVDNLFQTVPLLDHIKSAGGVEVIDGGQRITRAAILAEHSNITQLATGYESVSSTDADVLRSPEYEWCDFVAPIVITKKEELSNRGDNAVISIADARMKSVMGMLKREWELQAIRGTSATLTEMQTLEGQLPNPTTGWLEPFAFDSGNQVNTVGGLSKVTFQASNWNNQYATAGGNFGVNGLGAMANLAIDCQVFAVEGGIDLILASPNSYRLYKAAIQANERYLPKETVLDAGRLALAYNGALMYVESNLGNGVVPMSMYYLNTKTMKVVFDSSANFSVGDFENKSGYAAREAHIYVRTQLVADHLASLGLLVNAEA